MKMSYGFDLATFENKIAIVNEFGEHFYYGDLINVCSKLGSFFGAKDKKLVLVLAKNNVESIIGYLTAIQSNHAVMLIDADLDEELLNDLVHNYTPDFIWGPQKNNATKIFQYRNYELFKIGSKNKSKLHPALSLLLSTSGSTGSPKQVRLTKDNLASNARSIATYLNLNETEKPITNLPIYYSYGLSIINSHLIVGATILLTDIPVVKKEFWDFFRLGGGTSLTGVPYTYEILKRIGFFKMDLPSLRYMTQAGGKMDPQLILEYAELSQRKNFEFYIMYGATEATARIAYLSPKYNILKPGSIGKAIPNGKMKLIDESGHIITQPNVEGELVYQGPNVMMGYAHCRNDLLKCDELCGVLKTGDIAYFDADGFYYITGRKNNFLKILGKRVSLFEVERHLSSLGFNCFCGGEDDMLFIAYHQEKILDNQEEVLKKIRKEVFFRYKIPLDLINVFRVNNIPRSSSGKFNYYELIKNRFTVTSPSLAKELKRK